MALQKKVMPHVLGQGADFRVKRYFFIAPIGWTYHDLMDPSAWAPVVQQNMLSMYDLIRVRAADGHFDMQFTVTNVIKGGATLEPWPKLPTEIEALTGQRDLHVVGVGFDGRPSVRVEEVETSPFSANKVFRVIALDGTELSQHPTVQEAEGARDAYLAKLGYRLPTAEEGAAMLADRIAKEEERQIAVAAQRERMSGRRPAARKAEPAA